MSAGNTQHTPGPWMRDTVDGFTTINVRHRGQTGQVITHMFDRHGQFQNAYANACLIAAAPDLLLCLQRLVSLAQYAPFDSSLESALVGARAALAKAGV